MLRRFSRVWSGHDDDVRMASSIMTYLSFASTDHSRQRALAVTPNTAGDAASEPDAGAGAVVSGRNGGVDARPWSGSSSSGVKKITNSRPASPCAPLEET